MKCELWDNVVENGRGKRETEIKGSPTVLYLMK